MWLWPMICTDPQVFNSVPEPIGGILLNPRDHAPVYGDQVTCPLPVHMSDTELNDIFSSCMPALRKAAKRMLRNQQDSEDALQEGLLLAVRNLHQFEGRSTFLTWLYAIVRNASRAHCRKKSNCVSKIMDQTLSESTEFPSATFMDQQLSPEEAVIRQQRSSILQKMTKELPDSYQAAIAYFYMSDLGEFETAKRLGVTVSSLKAQLHRSRRILTCRIRKVYLPNMSCHACSRKRYSGIP